jgi:hypothetical protein
MRSAKKEKAICRLSIVMVRPRIAPCSEIGGSAVSTIVGTQGFLVKAQIIERAIDIVSLWVSKWYSLECTSFVRNWTPQRGACQ